MRLTRCPPPPIHELDPSPLDEDSLESAIEALAHREGDALDQVFHIAYEDLRRLARARLRSIEPGQTLNTTALVHEAYIRASGGKAGPRWSSPSHFFAFASKAMRHILVDHARRRHAQMRGGADLRQITLTEKVLPETSDDPLDLLALDRALRLLGERDPRLERVVECRFFSGLTADETADVLQVSSRTVERDWLKARAYLRHLMSE